MCRLNVILRVVLCILSGTTSLCVTTSVGDGAILYEFVSLEYEWYNESEKKAAIGNGEFIVENNIIAGIKVFNETVYVTVPKFLPGVPASLNKVVRHGVAVVLRPFPSWDMHRVGDCVAIQYTQSMEIDTNTGYMWIIDTGRISISRDSHFSRSICPPKLIVFDLNSNREIRRYEFPESVVSRDTNFLNDIVLDYVDGEARYAYISDSNDARLYIYDYETNESYYKTHATMAKKPLDPITQSNLTATSINGLAMSSDFKYVYYCTLPDRTQYAVPTVDLRQKSIGIENKVINIGMKIGGSDGIVFGRHRLYYGVIEKNAVYMADVGADGLVSMATQTALISNNRTIFVDSLAISQNYLYFVANNAVSFIKEEMDFHARHPNMYIWKVYVGENGYLYDAHVSTVTNSATCRVFPHSICALFFIFVSVLWAKALLQI